MSELKSAWTDSLLEEYGKLPLPSLYEILLMHEKLAMEIRRQNRELRNCSERLNQLVEPAQEDNVAAMQSSLLQVTDTALQLLQSSEKCFAAILQLVPEKRRFFFFAKKSWRRQLENMIEGYQAGIHAIYQKLETALEATGIELIRPAAGNAFDPLIHKAVEIAPGDRALEIQTLVRCGYAAGEKILRPAEVVISR